MSRDYAPRSSARRQPRKTRSRNSGVPGWIWLIAGLSVGLAVAAFVYIRQPAPPLNGQTADAAPATNDAGQPARTDKKGKALPLPPKEKQRFTFYEILKNQEVVLPDDAVKSSKPPSVPSAGNKATAAAPNAGAGNTGGSYIIQVASFRSQGEAEKQKASLALLGVESRIESVTIDGKNTYYRVRIGPDGNWPHVQNTMSRLESNGIQAMLVKVN